MSINTLTQYCDYHDQSDYYNQVDLLGAPAWHERECVHVRLRAQPRRAL